MDKRSDETPRESRLFPAELRLDLLLDPLVEKKGNLARLRQTASM